MSASEHASDSSTVFCVVGFCVVGCRCVRWLLCVDLATSVERKQTKKRKRAFCFVLCCCVVAVVAVCSCMWRLCSVSLCSVSLAVDVFAGFFVWIWLRRWRANKQRKARGRFVLFCVVVLWLWLLCAVLCWCRWLLHLRHQGFASVALSKASVT